MIEIIRKDPQSIVILDFREFIETNLKDVAARTTARRCSNASLVVRLRCRRRDLLVRALHRFETGGVCFVAL